MKMMVVMMGMKNSYSENHGGDDDATGDDDADER